MQEQLLNRLCGLLFSSLSFPFFTRAEILQPSTCLPALQTPLPSSILPLCLMGSDLVSRWSWLHQLQAKSSCSPRGEVHASPEPRSMATAGTSEVAKWSWHFSCVWLLCRISKLVLQDQPLVEQHFCGSKQGMAHTGALAQKCLKRLGFTLCGKGSWRGWEAEDMNP